MTNPPSLSPANPQSLTPNPCWYACLYHPPDFESSAVSSFDKLRTTLSPVEGSTVNVVNALVELAQDFSPRYQAHRDDLIVIDVSGLDRLFGDPCRIGEELRQSARARGLRVQIAIAATQTAAMVLAVARPGLTVIRRGDEGGALAPIAIGILDRITDRPPGTLSSPKHRDHQRSVGSVISVVKRWGVKTLGDLAALPADQLAVRLGQQGLTWQTLARGQDIGPLVPTLADERFESSIELEWPIEGLEPLSFVLTRLLEPLSTRLERRDRGAAVLHVTLGLVVHHDIDRRPFDRAQGRPELVEGRDRGERRENLVQDSASSGVSALNVVADVVYTRSLQLPSPMRDVRTLRTLILLDLESHPPAAPIEWVAVVIDPTPGRVLQHALFVRAHPTPEQLSTLIARLHALMGEDRVGRPSVVDSYRPGAFGMRPFAVEHGDRGRRGDGGRGGREDPERTSSSPSFVSPSASSASSASSTRIVSALRRCRRPVPARVSVADGRPALVTTDRRGFAGGRVLACAGPWRSSGHWWAGGADRAGGAGKAGGERPSHERSVPPLQPWDRDEWDVSLSDGAVYRIFQDRVTEGWFIDAIVD